MLTTTQHRPTTVDSGAAESERITVHGDFNSPWSYLAFRRASVLAAAGVEVDWRAVEHAPPRPGEHDDASARLARLPEDMKEVLDMLLPEEELPHDLAGFLPRTAAAVAAYAEGYAAHVAARVARILFESFWIDGKDIGNVNVLRDLLVDELRGSASPSPTIRDWGVPVSVTGAPISMAAWQLVRDWDEQWKEIGDGDVPVLRPADGEPMHGVTAVEWLGNRVVELGLGVNPPKPAHRVPDRRELPTLGWVSENGGRWLRAYQRGTVR